MAKFNIDKEIVIRLPLSSYPILIGSNLLNPTFLSQYLLSQHVVIVTNKTIAPLYLNRLQDLVVDKQSNVVILDDGEVYKNQESLFKIYDVLMRHQSHRDTTLVALGGGVIGDITGFAAATYQRGISFVQIPTTLLAQIDASIGGKTAINYHQAKNMIGSFYQPQAVIIDVETLKTLPLREFRAGLGELIKYALLEGGDFLAWVYQALTEGLALNTYSQLSELITRCCQIKARFVQLDERDQGQRALLNLGHTFAHALEAYTHYNRWLHGEAVAIGLYCAAFLSCHWGVLDKNTLLLVDEMLCMANLPCRIPNDIVLSDLFLLMQQDKKIINNKLKFILLKAAGNPYIEEGLCLNSVGDLFKEMMN